MSQVVPSDGGAAMRLAQHFASPWRLLLLLPVGAGAEGSGARRLAVLVVGVTERLVLEPTLRHVVAPAAREGAPRRKKGPEPTLLAATSKTI